MSMMKLRNYTLALALILLAGLVLSASVEATTVTKLKFDEIIEKADLILSGKVIAVSHRVINEKGNKIPYTFVTLSVSENIKGPAEKISHTIKLLGGPIPEENATLHVSDMPEFKVDQEIFLFLEDNNVLESPVVGFNQGKFRIQTDRNTGRTFMANRVGKAVTEMDLYGETARYPSLPVNYEMFRNYVKSRIKK
jgi:hypothetical protein